MPIPRYLLFVLLIVVITIIVLSLLLRSKVYHTLYQPLRRRTKRDPEADYEELYIDTRRHEVYYSNPHIVRNRIHCWYLNKYEGAPVIYYLHGNNTDLHSCRFMLDLCKIIKYNLFMIDYRGFGRSSLDYVTNQNMIEDASAGYSFLQGRYPSERIIVWGTSLGSHVALHLAVTHTIHALILLSPYSTLHNLYEDMTVPRVFLSEPLKALTMEWNRQTTNLRLAKKVKCKTIVVHSQDDDLIPIRHSRLVHEKLNKHVEREFVDIKGPHDGPVFTPTQFKRILKFIDCPTHDLHSIEKLLDRIHSIERVTVV